MLIQGDASNLEGRCAAFLSQDKILISELENKVDLHTENQKRFKLPNWEFIGVDKDKAAVGRLIAKTLLFRINSSPFV